MRQARTVVGMAAALLAGSVVLAAPADAAVLTVTTRSDGGPGSLRAVLAEAAAQTEVTVVNLPGGTYELTVCDPGTGSDGGDQDGSDLDGSDLDGSDPDGGDLDLQLEWDRDVSVVGAAVIRQTCPGERVVDQRGPGRLSLTGLTVTGGTITGTDPTVQVDGGGVRAEGDLTLDGVTVAGNSVAGAPGVAAPAGGTAVPGGAAAGAGVWVGGALMAANTTVSANTATGGPGADAVGALPDDPVDDGVAAAGGAAYGAGIQAGGPVTFTGGALSANSALAGDGGRPAAGGGLARGGGLASSSAELRGTRLEGNRARAGASGALSQPGGVFGGGSGVVAPGGAAEGGAVSAGDYGGISAVDVTATGNTATGGTAGHGGGCGTGVPCLNGGPPGAARGGALGTGGDVRVENGTWSANAAVSGDTFATSFSMAGVPIGVPKAAATGGAVSAGRTVRITGGVWDANRADAGLGFPERDGPGAGGAASAGTDATVTGARFTANTTNGRGGAVSGGAAVTASGSTFTGNRAGGRGGALDAGGLAASDLTVSGNTAGGTGGGGIAVAGNASVSATTVADNTVSSSFVQSNPGVGGGGIRVGGALGITTSTVRGNTGAAVFNVGILCQGCPAGFTGGGIRAGAVNGTAVTVAGNHGGGITTGPPPAPQPPFGGPAHGGGIAADGSVVLVNATLDGNSSGPVDTGTPPFPVLPNPGSAVRAASVVLDHTTVGDHGAGSPVLATPELLTNRSVVVATAERPACAPGTAITGSSWNWFTDASCALAGPGDEQRPALLLLGPLAANGGPVPTRAPAEASVLIDRIPRPACPVAADARGTARPQGPRCDVGAVEAVLGPAPAPTDMAVAFTDPPGSVTPGIDATWRVTVTNRGPAAAVPALVVDVPAGLKVTAATSDGGVVCTTVAPVTCLLPGMAAGASRTVTLIGRVDAALVEPVVLSAQVVVRSPAEPRADDRARLRTPVAPRADLVMTVAAQRAWDGPGHVITAVSASVTNRGPSHARGTEERPIEVTFTPARGVRVVVDENGTTTDQPVTRTFVGSFATNVGDAWFELAVSGAVPARVGTVELRPGATRDPDGTGRRVPVGAADLAVRASRPSGPQAPGTPTMFTVEVTNRGPAAATDVSVSLYDGGARATYTVDRGTIEEGKQLWRIPSLAPGETAYLTGTATPEAYPTLASRFQARVSTSVTVDFNDENDGADLDLDAAPGGTANLRVSRLTIEPGARPDQRVLRATVLNEGPAPAAATAEWPIAVRATPFPDARVVAVSSPTPGWTCEVGEWDVSCRRTSDLPPGGRVEVEVVLEGTFPDRRPRPGVQAMSSITAESTLGDNLRYVTVS